MNYSNSAGNDMLKCPLCDKTLLTQTSEGWQCECGELIPFGLEIDSGESCESCPVIYCPKRKRPAAAELNEMKV